MAPKWNLKYKLAVVIRIPQTKQNLVSHFLALQRTAKKCTKIYNARAQLLFSSLRACLHGDGGPQVGEVTRLAVVEKWPAFTCKLTTPGSRGDFT